MYFKGLWDKDKTISELKYYKKITRRHLFLKRLLMTC